MICFLAYSLDSLIVCLSCCTSNFRDSILLTVGYCHENLHTKWLSPHGIGVGDHSNASRTITTSALGGCAGTANWRKLRFVNGWLMAEVPFDIGKSPRVSGVERSIGVESAKGLRLASFSLPSQYPQT